MNSPRVLWARGPSIGYLVPVSDKWRLAGNINPPAPSLRPAAGRHRGMPPGPGGGRGTRRRSPAAGGASKGPRGLSTPRGPPLATMTRCALERRRPPRTSKGGGGAAAGRRRRSHPPPPRPRPPRVMAWPRRRSEAIAPATRATCGGGYKRRHTTHTPKPPQTGGGGMPCFVVMCDSTPNTHAMAPMAHRVRAPTQAPGTCTTMAPPPPESSHGTKCSPCPCIPPHLAPPPPPPPAAAMASWYVAASTPPISPSPPPHSPPTPPTPPHHPITPPHHFTIVPDYYLWRPPRCCEACWRRRLGHMVALFVSPSKYLPKAPTHLPPTHST
jgi:hypothetical protein